MPREWIFRVDGLAHEGPGAAAVRLFEERLAQASAHGASIGVAPGEVEELCAIVDGMPLAIELAASSPGTPRSAS